MKTSLNLDIFFDLLRCHSTPGDETEVRTDRSRQLTAALCQ